MRSLVVFGLLLSVKVLSMLFYRHEVRWVSQPPNRPWRGLRVVALLNHTSLFEVLFLGAAPLSLLWNMARHGVIPAAKKTTDRPLVGLFYRLVARQVIPITRQRDSTWDTFMARIGPRGLVILAPEGRMKRETGLDVNGKPMTVRGGIADVLEGLKSGGMLLAYSGGLHHVQVPGHWPKAFKRIRLGLERVDIADYVTGILQTSGLEGFKRAVVEDLQRRRDAVCGGTGATDPPVSV